jgi:hypothetical protein
MELREEMDLPVSEVGPGEETMMDLFGMKVFSDIGDVPFWFQGTGWAFVEAGKLLVRCCRRWRRFILSGGDRG